MEDESEQFEYKPSNIIIQNDTSIAKPVYQISLETLGKGNPVKRKRPTYY